ncbi:hypothetical protein PO909_018203 [Leuciscus waleckii]
MITAAGGERDGAVQCYEGEKKAILVTSHLEVVKELEIVSMGFRSLLIVKKSLGTVGAGLDDRGIVGGAGRVEGVFVLLSVKFVGFQVDSKTGFIGESFQLSAFGFEEVELVSVPRGGVCEGDRFGYKGGDGIETG